MQIPIDYNNRPSRSEVQSSGGASRPSADDKNVDLTKSFDAGDQL
jgi:hypothetical protein